MLVLLAGVPAQLRAGESSRRFPPIHTRDAARFDPRCHPDVPNDVWPNGIILSVDRLRIVRWVDRTNGIVWIHAGADDELKPGERLQVCSQEPCDEATTSPRVKAVIKLTRIHDRHLSEATILSEDAKAPIAVGDSFIRSQNKAAKPERTSHKTPGGKPATDGWPRKTLLQEHREKGEPLYWDALDWDPREFPWRRPPDKRMPRPRNPLDWSRRSNVHRTDR